MSFENALLDGIEQIVDHLTAHTWNSIIPAFLITGAIAVFLFKDAVLKYFSSSTNRFVSYTIASVSGVILAVCSCVIIPLFAGIRRRGAGIGPATTFLYSGPAINIMALAFRGGVLVSGQPFAYEKLRSMVEERIGRK
ncbi:MAG: permease [Candidatus Methanofastidiosa archaeon]|nr:permease [Candidatus Methanofastidiosa archaeon]